MNRESLKLMLVMQADIAIALLWFVLFVVLYPLVIVAFFVVSCWRGVIGAGKDPTEAEKLLNWLTNLPGDVVRFALKSR